MAIDWLILEKIQQIFGSGFCDWFMPRITVLGNAGIIWIIIGVAMLISKKYRKYGVLVLAGLLIGLIIGNGIVKNVVQRARPCWIDTNFKMLIAIPKDYSFPSGHALSSFAAAMAIFMNRRKMGVAALLFAFIMGCTRLYFYVHYPTDVLAGMLFGLILGFFAYWIATKGRKKWEERSRA